MLIGFNLRSTYFLQTCYESGTELINEDEVFLYLSTLDGTFIGVNHKNGEIKWQFKEGINRL